MAKIRIINTRFWIDDYISNLTPKEKLLFLYFLTNPFTDICGVYEIPVKQIAMDTGISKDEVDKIISKFEVDGKIVYEGGWVGIRNFAKHQSINPKVARGIEIGLKSAPKSITDRLSIGYDSLSHLNSNSNSNSNLNSNTKKTGAEAPIPPVLDDNKLIYGEFKNVKLEKDEYDKLIEKYGEKNTQVLIEELSGYMASKKTKYASHYAVLLNWARRKIQEYTQKSRANTNKGRGFA
jgi:hypothetical protein